MGSRLEAMNDACRKRQGRITRKSEGHAKAKHERQHRARPLHHHDLVLLHGSEPVPFTLLSRPDGLLGPFRDGLLAITRKAGRLAQIPEELGAALDLFVRIQLGEFLAWPRLGPYGAGTLCLLRPACGGRLASLRRAPLSGIFPLVTAKLPEACNIVDGLLRPLRLTDSFN
jgi:hypothetical protein